VTNDFSALYSVKTNTAYNFNTRIQNLYRVAKREILITALMTSQVLWDVTPRLLRNISGSFGGV